MAVCGSETQLLSVFSKSHTASGQLRCSVAAGNILCQPVLLVTARQRHCTTRQRPHASGRAEPRVGKQGRTRGRASDRKAQVGSGDRSERIRTYNFPQGRMTDHRIGLTLYRLEQILAGDLDEIIDALTADAQAAQLAEMGA